MANIKKIKAREILDSRGNPTVEVDVITKDGTFRAGVPSGASTGIHEALELRDGGKRYFGQGVTKAVGNVNREIAPLLKGKDCRAQERLDNLMISLDGTGNKGKLGANAILGVSLACARAAAGEVPLFKYINTIAPNRKMKIPRPFFNIINGGKHADNSLSFQEFMISPNMKTFRENLRVASGVYHTLKKILHRKYGKGSTNVGDEGGFAPWQLETTNQVLNLLLAAIKQSGYVGKVDIALDAAASEFFRNGKYTVDGTQKTQPQLLKYYLQLTKKYPIISIEDPFHQEDFVGFSELREKSKIGIVGDDLTVSNVSRIEKALEVKSCNCLLLKVNQIGTLTEALEAAQLAFKNGWRVMVSHRSGETEDPFIADLAVGIGAQYIKAGAPCRGERTAKYNQLLRIEEFLRTS